MESLADRFSIRISPDLMHNNGRINPRYFFIASSKYITKFFKQGRISFNLIKTKRLDELNVFHYTRFLRNVDEHSQCNITQISLKQNIMSENRGLRHINNFRRNKGCIVILECGKILKERRSMMMIFPRKFLQTHNLDNRLVQRKSL